MQQDVNMHENMLKNDLQYINVRDRHEASCWLNHPDAPKVEALEAKEEVNYNGADK